jgi:bacteriorhodopsin
MVRLLPLVICWLIVPINIALYASFLASATHGTIRWSYFSIFLGLCAVQIVTGLITAVTAPKKEGSEPAPAIARLVFGALGALLGLLALLFGGAIPMLVRL